MTENREIRTFMESVEWPESCGRIFELLPDIALWIKDVSGRFMTANQNFLQLCGLQQVEDLLGKTDYDIWPKYLADGYVKDDRKVLRSGESIVNRIELVRNTDRSTSWLATTKVPFSDKCGNVVGAAGFAVNLKHTDATIKPILKMEPAIDYIMNHYTESIEIKELAALMCFSVSAFERNFKKQFNQTPIKYINSIRMDAAVQLLLNTGDSVSEIAVKTGFYDSSHFTRQFVRHTGRTPSRFREFYSGDKAAR